MIIWFSQIFATFLCIVGALKLIPIKWIKQRYDNKALTSEVKKGL